MDDDRGSDDGGRIEKALEQLPGLNASERSALIDETSDGGPEFHTQVKQLLDCYDAGREFVERLPDPPSGASGAQNRTQMFSAGEVVAARFHIIRLLGAGGLGEVYEAEDLVLKGEPVALKTLRASLAADETAVARLTQELLLARRISHPNVCRVYDVYQHPIASGAPISLFTMELIDGETLATRVRRGRIATTDALPLVRQMAEAIDAAHAANVAHGDLKPGNIMLVPSTRGADRVVVTDFGLARWVPVGTTLLSTTLESRQWGTPVYMAPEQLLGRPVTRASDIYALGVVCYEMVTGEQPFTIVPPLLLAVQKLRRAPRPPRELVPDLNPRWQAAILRCLDVDPGRRFQLARDLVDELERGPKRRKARVIGSPSPTAVGVAVEPFEGTPFVGREAEASDLRRLLERMLTGHGGVALVGGEPGIGKTRLARELLHEARQRGCRCLTGHCDEVAGAPPFAPFIETMEEAVRIGPQTVRRALADVAPEIATIVPSLRRAFSDIPPSPELPADQQRRLVFSAYVDYVRRSTQQSPAVVLFDDLHWADKPTLQLLVHLAPHVASLRLLVVGTYRDVELEVTRPFAQTLESLFRQRLATRITLRRMTESGVQQMLAGMGGSPPPSGLSEAVFKETEGNPFFVEEVYQHLAEEGRLFDATGAWRGDLHIGALDVPEGVRLVIGRRLDRLADTTRKVLTAAAVIGRTVPIDVLQAVVDVSDEDVLDALEEAERAQLVAPEAPQRTAQYGFVHELIRATLVNRLSLPRRQRAHLKIADALERLRADRLDPHISAIAHHLYQAGAASASERTGKFLALAGRRALAAGAFEDALDTSEHLIGLELADSDPQLADAFEQRGAALQALRRPDEGVTAWERALTLHAGRRDDAGIVRAAQAIGRSFGNRGRMPESIDAVNRALKTVSSSAAAERASLHAMLVLPSLYVLAPDIAWDYLDQAIASAERIGNPSLMGHVLRCQATAHRLCGESDAGLETGTQAIALIPEEALADRADLTLHLLSCNYRSGRFADVIRLIPDFEVVARRAGNPLAPVVIGFTQSAHQLNLLGDLRAFLERSEILSDGAPLWRYRFLITMAAARLQLGDTESALAQLARAVAEPPPPDQLFRYKGVAEALQFSGTALVGRVEGARKLFGDVERWLPGVHKHNLAGAWAILDACVPGLRLADDVVRCGELYPSCVNYVGTGAMIEDFSFVPGNPQTVAGIAAHAAGLRDRAQDHFEIAVRQADTLPNRLLQPTARYWYGRLLIDDPHPTEQTRGRAMIEAAATDFRSLGMVTYANLAEHLLQQ